MRSTEDVLDHHAKCFFEFDLEGILSDYSPTAVLFTPDGPLRGADAIRPLFQAMFAEFGKPGATFHMKHQSVEGSYAYVLWTAETADNVYELGGHVSRAGRQDRRPVIRGQDFAQGLKHVFISGGRPTSR
jgi:ketosteroid isomerase-like protein